MALMYLAAFLVGLLLGVFLMLTGVERQSPVMGSVDGSYRPGAAPQQARVRLPSIAAFAAVFGATGYGLLRASTLGIFSIFLISALGGLCGVVAAAVLIAKWAVPGANHDIVDERYVLQGQIARVTSTITLGGAGVIAYEQDGTQQSRDARAVHAEALLQGTDVVIERIEEGTAYVEPWSRVEERL